MCRTYIIFSSFYFSYIFLFFFSLAVIYNFFWLFISELGMIYNVKRKKTHTQQRNIFFMFKIFLNSTNSSSKKSHICTMYDHCLKETIPSNESNRCEAKIWCCGQCSKDRYTTTVKQTEKWKGPNSLQRDWDLGRWGKKEKCICKNVETNIIAEKKRRQSDESLHLITNRIVYGVWANKRYFPLELFEL